MTIDETPPRWLAWANTEAMKAVTTVVAAVALLAASVLGIRQQAYINCVGKQQNDAARRTTEISRATDAERAAQRALITAVDPKNADQLRDAVLRAYDATDRARAANPPTPPGKC